MLDALAERVAELNGTFSSETAPTGTSITVATAAATPVAAASRRLVREGSRGTVGSRLQDRAKRSKHA